MIRFQIFDGYSEESGSLLDLQIQTNVTRVSRSGEATGSNFKLLIVLKIQQDDRDARFHATYDSLGINWKCDLKVTLNWEARPCRSVAQNIVWKKKLLTRHSGICFVTTGMHYSSASVPP